MTHPEAHTLELYVLNAESVAAWRDAIEEHLRTCAGCKALVTEMSEFYTQLDEELRKEEVSPAVPGGSSLIKRNPGLSIWNERLTVGGTWAPVRKLRHYLRKYPLAAAGTTFGFAALAVAGILAGYRGLTRDVNPVYAELNKLSGYFEVYNRSNDLLWKRLVAGIDSVLSEQNVRGSPKYTIFDYDGDGRNEVLTTIQLQGQPVVPDRGLHIFDGSGNFRDLGFSRKAAFLGAPYELPVVIEGGSFIGIDSGDPGNPEILVTAKNDRSPNALVRMDRHGAVLGEYWHHGQFRSLRLHDLDGDGRPELILCGTNDVHDDVGPAEPVLIVLDPKKIIGQTESRASRGYGHAPSEAELYYIKLPLTDVNLSSHAAAGMNRVMIAEDRIRATWNFRHTDNTPYDLEFIFSRTFEPLRVISTTQIKELFDREYSLKRIPARMDEAYLLKLRSEIRFWNGREWSPEPVRVGAGPDGHVPN